MKHLSTLLFTLITVNLLNAQSIGFGSNYAFESDLIGFQVTFDAPKIVGLHLSYSAGIQSSVNPSGKRILPEDVPSSAMLIGFGRQNSIIEFGIRYLVSDRLAIALIIPTESVYLISNYITTTDNLHVKLNPITQTGVGGEVTYYLNNFSVQVGYDTIKEVFVGLGYRIQLKKRTMIQSSHFSQ